MNIEKKALLIFTFLILILANALAQTYTLNELTKSYGNLSVEYGDLNNDGVQDIISMGIDLSYYLGQGNNQFGMKNLLADTFYVNVTANHSALQVGDINENGFIDIVYGVSASNILIVLKNDSLTFTRDTMNIDSSLSSVILIDVNNDGYLDLITNHNNPASPHPTTQYSQIYLNNGFGSFYNGVYLNLYSFMNVWNKKVDLSGNGLKDALIGQRQSTGWPVNYFNLGIDFASSTPQPFNFVSILSNNSFFAVDGDAMDINEDGLVDIILAFNGTNSIHFQLRNTDGGFNSHSSDTVSYRPAPRKILCHDFDEDGKKDLLWCSNNEIVWYKVDASGDFVYQSTLFDGFDIGSIIHFDYQDINNDGFKDFILVGKHEIFHIINNGLNIFPTYERILRVPYNPKNVAFGDINGNGLQDMVYSSNYNGSGNVYDLVWQENLNNGEFSKEKIIARTGFNLLAGPKLGDMNGDGLLDIIVSCNFLLNSAWQNQKMVVFMNLGGGDFSSPQIIGNLYANSIELFDSDDDGHLDIIASSVVLSNQSQLILFKNNGNGNSFNPIVIASEQTLKNRIVIADINGDGLKDISVVFGNKIKYYINDNGSFSNNNSVFFDVVTSNLKVADFDNDGFNDYLVVRSAGATPNVFIHHTIFKNNGLGEFSDTLHHAFNPQAGANFNELLALDFNDDSEIDFFSVEHSKIFYHKNLGNGIFAERELFYGSPNHGVEISAYDINSNGRKEIIHANWTHETIRSIHRVIPGDAPLFESDTITACPGEQIYLEILNQNMHNDNSYWALHYESCNSAIIDTSLTGAFVFNTYVSGNFCVNAMGGVEHEGACGCVYINVNSAGNLPPPNIDITDITFNAFEINAQTNTPSSLAWEYSLNYGADWSIPQSFDIPIDIVALSPNTCYSLLVRDVSDSIFCTANAAALIQVCTTCSMDIMYDTILVCANEAYLFPDGHYEPNITNSITRNCELISSSGCDSLLIVTVQNPEPENYSIFDTICFNASYTFLNGVTVSNIQESFIEQHPNFHNGCPIGTVNYHVSVLIADSTLQLFDSVCMDDSYMLLDSSIIENITQDIELSHPLWDITGCQIGTVYYQISIINQVQQNDSLFVCYGEQITFDDGYTMSNITSNNTYQYTTNVNSTCDTLFNISIFVYQNSYAIIYDTICLGDVYTMMNQVFSQTGTYEIPFLDTNNCESFNELNLTVIDCSDLSIIPSEQPSISVYPNPANDLVYLRYLNSLTISSAVLYDSKGKKIFDIYDSYFSVKSLFQGVYYLHLILQNQSETLKIVVNH